MSYLQLLKSQPRPLIFGFTVAFFSGVGQTHFIAIFSPFLMSLFALSNTQYGLLYSLATLASGLMLPVIGPFLDRINIRIFCLLMGIGMIISEFLLIYGQWLPILAFALFSLRLLGQGLCSHVSNVGTARYFTDNRGKALAIAFLGMPLSEALLTPTMAYFITLTPWQNICLIMAALVLFIYLPVVLLVTRGNNKFNQPNLEVVGPSKSAKIVSTIKSWTRKEVFSQPTIYFFLPHAIMPPFTLTGVLFHQGAIAEMKGWTLTQIASGLLFFAISRSIVSFIAGPIIDRYGAVRLFPYHLIPLVLGFVILASSNHLSMVFLCFTLFGVCVGMASPLKSALWAEMYGPAHLGSINSALGTVMVISTAISPALFGYILDARQEPMSLLLGMAVLTVFTSLCSWLHLHRGRGSRFLPAS